MRRRFVLFCAAGFVAACGRGPAAIGEPPASLGGGAWARGPVARPPVSGAPENVRSFNPKEWLRAEYRQGGSVVQVDLFRMPGGPSAFEARQKWLGESGAASLHHGDLFIVAASDTEQAGGLGRFLRLLEAEWLSGHQR